MLQQIGTQLQESPHVSTSGQIQDNMTTKENSDTKMVADHVTMKVAEGEPCMFVGWPGLAMFAHIEHIAQRGGLADMMHALQRVVPTSLDEATALVVGTFYSIDTWGCDKKFASESVAVVRHLDAAISAVISTTRDTSSSLPYEKAIGQLEYIANRLDHKLISWGRHRELVEDWQDEPHVLVHVIRALQQRTVDLGTAKPASTT